jgi:LuxR family maltose regulon positive regulatory protein
LAQGQLENAIKWAEERGLRADQPSKRLLSIEYLAFVRILIAQGRLDEANGLIDQIIEITEQRGLTTRQIELLILKALASHAQDAASEAMAALEQALTLAKPRGFIRIFVDEGPLMGQLLYEAMSQGITSEYTGHLLALITELEPDHPTQVKTQKYKDEIIEQLSEREIEVLKLIAQGFTNKEIASRLYVSLNTIKVHTRNINSKLGTHNRTESTAKARLLGILPRG